MSTDDKRRTGDERRIGAPDPEQDSEPRGKTKDASSPAGERRVVATAHADASPAKENDDVRPIGNTDVPVTARDPDAP